MQLDTTIITAVVAGAVSLITAFVTYKSQQDKIKSESRSAAEAADELVFSRLQVELARRDSRIDELEKRLSLELARLADLRIKYYETERANTKLQVELEEERRKRRILEERVKKQGYEISELRSENQNLHVLNRELTVRLEKVEKNGSSQTK